jgi:hypothetical protein
VNHEPRSSENSSHVARKFFNEFVQFIGKKQSILNYSHRFHVINQSYVVQFKVGVNPLLCLNEVFAILVRKVDFALLNARLNIECSKQGNVFQINRNKLVVWSVS